MEEKTIIGRSELVDLPEFGLTSVPAKIDTGADASSIWASNIDVDKEGVLSFSLFAEGSPLYTGEIIRRKDYRVAVVRSAMGEEQVRYRLYMDVVIRGRKVRGLFGLSDRSRNNFSILIGRKTIAGEFLVDVSQSAVEFPKNPRNLGLNDKLKADPYSFHQEYVKNRKEKDL